MKRHLIILFCFLLTAYTWARVKPKADNPFDLADCVFTGEFTGIEPLKINGHDLRPVSISAGTFKVKKLVKGKNPLCSISKDEIEVVFSNGKSNAIGSGEHCQEPQMNQKDHKLALNVALEGTFVPAGCFSWVSEEK